MADRSDSLKLYEDQPQEVTTADILRRYGPEPDERGMLLPISRTGGKLSLDWPSAIYEPYQAIKRLVTRPVAPGYLSSSGDRGPIEDSFNAAAAVAAPSLGLNYAGMAPKNAVGIFGGRLAKTADQAALARAEEMAAKGADRRAIWDETGWFQGADGKWRFEIDDSKSFIPHPTQNRVTHQGEASGSAMVAGLKHDDLYAAYPDLRRTEWEIKNTPNVGGAFDPNRGPVGHISAQGPHSLDRQSVLLHELQHAVQGPEKFATGASGSTYTQQAEATMARDALAWRRELERMPKGMDRSAKENAVIDQYRELGAMDWVPSREVRDLAQDFYGNPTPQLEEIVKFYGLDKKTTPYTPKQLYERTAGEVEARNVQKRMNMTPEERRATPPWESQDVPDTQQILRMYGDGPQMSASMPAPIRAYHGTSNSNLRFEPHGDYELGPHFGTAEQANARLAFKGGHPEGVPYEGGSVLPVDLHLRNPLEIRDPGMFDAHNLPHAMKETGKFTPDEIKRLSRHEHDLFDLEDNAAYREATGAFYDTLSKIMRDNGYDSFSYRNTAEHPEINALMQDLRKSYGNETEISNLFAKKRAIEERLAESGDLSYVPIKRGTVKSATTGKTLFSGGADPLTTQMILRQYGKDED